MFPFCELVLRAKIYKLLSRNKNLKLQWWLKGMKRARNSINKNLDSLKYVQESAQGAFVMGQSMVGDWMQPDVSQRKLEKALEAWNVQDLAKRLSCTAPDLQATTSNLDDIADDDDDGTRSLDTYDEEGGIHPRNKQIVGERLRISGGNVAYGVSEYPANGPFPDRMNVQVRGVIKT